MTAQIPTMLSADRFAVRTQSLTKRYGKHFALDRADFCIPENAFYVLVGPNGAGKTTFFKLLLELIVPTSGSIDVLGIDPRVDGARVRAHIGYVPESSADLYTWMDVKRALAFHRAYFPAWDHQYAAQLMTRLQLREGKLQKLSKGETRRVQLIMALAHRPPVLLLDEPSDGLDPQGREIFTEILASHIADNATTVIVSTHLVFELERLADHLAVLGNGHVVAQLSTDELRRKLKRYVVNASNGVHVIPPADATVHLNGSEREKAWTLWGEEQFVTSHLRENGAEIRDVRSLTLHEAAVAFLGMERV